MKSIFLLSAILVTCIAGYAQKQKDSSAHYPMVHIKDWTQYSMIIFDEIWDNAKDEIVRQIGDSEFDYISKNYGDLPSQMRMYDGATKTTTAEELDKRLNKIKTLYKIARFKHVIKGKYWGNLLIIQVPYKGNESWDSTAKWDKVYFIFPEKAVEEIQSFK